MTMKALRYLNSLNTMTWVWLTVAVMVVATVMDGITGPLWVHFGLHATALEYISMGLGWCAYALLLALIPISAFRPERRFYLRGDCRLRAKRCGFVVWVNVVVYLLFVIAMIVMKTGLGHRF